MMNLDIVVKSQDNTADKDPYNQRYDFSSSRVQM